MTNPMEYCPPTDCPACGLDESSQTKCPKCGFDCVCWQCGCSNCGPVADALKSVTEPWVMYAKRTEDPKLAWIERSLMRMGIPSRRNGYSFHGPILEVPESRLTEADTILNKRVGRYRIDDIRDDHPRWEMDKA